MNRASSYEIAFTKNIIADCKVQILTQDSAEASHLSWAWVMHDKDVREKIMVCLINSYHSVEKWRLLTSDKVQSISVAE